MNLDGHADDALADVLMPQLQISVLSVSVVHHPGVIRGEGALDSTPDAVGSRREPKNLMKWSPP